MNKFAITPKILGNTDFLTDNEAQQRQQELKYIIDDLMLKRGCSMTEIAKSVNISQGNMSDYYRNVKKVSKKTLERVRSAYNLPITQAEQILSLRKEIDNLNSLLAIAIQEQTKEIKELKEILLKRLK